MAEGIPGPKFEVLQDVLARAFHKDGLRELARIDLPGALDEINWDQPESTVAFNLLAWAEQTGNVDGLIQAVYRRRGDNACVRAIAERWPAWLRDPEPTPACQEPYPEPGPLPPPPRPPIPPVLGGVVLLLIVGIVGYIIYRANDGNGTATPVAQPQAAGNAVLRDLRVVESALGRTFLASLLQLRDASCVNSDACLQQVLQTWLGEQNADIEAAESVPTYAQTEGLVFHVVASFTGLAGVECPIFYTVYDVTDGTPSEIQDRYLRNQPGFPYRAVTPEGDTDTDTLELWVPMPPRNGTFQLGLSVHEGAPVAGSIPEVVMSDQFRIENGQWVAAGPASVTAPP